MRVTRHPDFRSSRVVSNQVAESNDVAKGAAWIQATCGEAESGFMCVLANENARSGGWGSWLGAPGLNVELPQDIA